MKSRMAIMSMLVLGVLASGTGTGLAVSGVSDSGSAGQAQYPTAAPDRGSAGDRAGGGNAGDNVLGRQQGSDTDVAGAQESGNGGVQTTRQVSVQQEDDSLPFTGLAAIPLILMGLALLTAGVVLRRRLPDTA